MGYNVFEWIQMLWRMAFSNSTSSSLRNWPRCQFWGGDESLKHQKFHVAIFSLQLSRHRPKNTNYSLSWSKSWFGNRRKSPELVDIKDCWKAALVVMHLVRKGRNEYILKNESNTLLHEWIGCQSITLKKIKSENVNWGGGRNEWYRNQLVFVKDEEAEPSLLKHAVLLIFP